MSLGWECYRFFEYSSSCDSDFADIEVFLSNLLTGWNIWRILTAWPAVGMSLGSGVLSFFWIFFKLWFRFFRYWSFSLEFAYWMKYLKDTDSLTRFRDVPRLDAQYRSNYALCIVFFVPFSNDGSDFADMKNFPPNLPGEWILWETLTTRLTLGMFLGMMLFSF